MTRLIPGELLLGILLVGIGIAPAQSVPAPFPNGETSPACTWRLVDVWWDLGKEQVFDSLGFDVTISDDFPPKADLFLAPIGLGYLNETPFQGGLQTLVETGSRGQARPGPMGPGLIFTLHAEHSIDAARPALCGLRRSSGPEGDSVSVVRPYAWTKGKYSYRIKRQGREIIRGKPFTWVQATLVRHHEHDELILGSLRFPGEQLMLSRQLDSFVEIYTPERTLGETPKLSVTLENLQINGRPVEYLTALAEYPEGVPDFAVASGNGTSVSITLGHSVPNRRARRVDLLPRADTPSSQSRIGKFELLAIYTYARALRDGLTDNEAKERGITAAVMGAKSHGLTRGASDRKSDSQPAKSKVPKAKKKTFTADLFDQQVAHKLEPCFTELILPRMKQLVATGLSYQKLKDTLKMPADVGAKMSAGMFEQRTSAYLKNQRKPQGS
jgi:hypothetical protein